MNYISSFGSFGSSLPSIFLHGQRKDVSASPRGNYPAHSSRLFRHPKEENKVSVVRISLGHKFFVRPFAHLYPTFVYLYIYIYCPSRQITVPMKLRYTCIAPPLSSCLCFIFFLAKNQKIKQKKGCFLFSGIEPSSCHVMFPRII